MARYKLAAEYDKQDKRKTLFSTNVPRLLDDDVICEKCGQVIPGRGMNAHWKSCMSRGERSLVRVEPVKIYKRRDRKTVETETDNG